MSSRRVYESGFAKRKAKEQRTISLELMRGSMTKFLRKISVTSGKYGLKIKISIFKSIFSKFSIIFL